MAERRPDLAYVVVDVETDGLLPGRNSMMSLAAVGADADGRELDSFSANLAPLPEAAPDPGTLSWWWTEPQAWAAATRDQELPEVVMPRFVHWVRTLPGGLRLALRLEGRSAKLEPRQPETDRNPIFPQVILQASGDLTPFDLLFSRDGTKEQRRLSGTLEGRIELHDDAREQARR